MIILCCIPTKYFGIDYFLWSRCGSFFTRWGTPAVVNFRGNRNFCQLWKNFFEKIQPKTVDKKVEHTYNIHTRVPQKHVVLHVCTYKLVWGGHIQHTYKKYFLENIHVYVQACTYTCMFSKKYFLYVCCMWPPHTSLYVHTCNTTCFWGTLVCMLYVCSTFLSTVLGCIFSKKFFQSWQKLRFPLKLTTAGVPQRVKNDPHRLHKK